MGCLLLMRHTSELISYGHRVAQTFFMDESIKEFARLDGIVTLVDAKHIVQHLDEEKPEGAENEAVEQVAFADRLLLNKIDLMGDDAAIAQVESRLREINKYAPIMRCQNAAVGMEHVLNLKAFELSRVRGLASSLLVAPLLIAPLLVAPLLVAPLLSPHLIPPLTSSHLSPLTSPLLFLTPHFTSPLSSHPTSPPPHPSPSGTGDGPGVPRARCLTHARRDHLQVGRLYLLPHASHRAPPRCHMHQLSPALCALPCTLYLTAWALSARATSTWSAPTRGLQSFFRKRASTYTA